MPRVAMQDGSVMDIPDISKLSDDEIDRLLGANEQTESPRPDINNLPGISLAPENLLTIPSTEEMLGATPSPIELGSLPERLPGAAFEMAKKSALPFAGEVGGAALGTLTGPFAPMLTPLLAGGLAMGGEYLNQKLGITEPSNLQLGIAGIAPPLFRGVGAAMKAAPELIGTGRAIKTLNKSAEKEMADFAIALQKETPSKTLFERAHLAGGLIDLSNTYDEAGRLLKTLRIPDKEAQYGDVIAQLESLRDWIRPPKQKRIRPAGFMTPKPRISEYIENINYGKKTPLEIQEELKSLGRKVANDDTGELKKIFGTMIDDIKDAKSSNAFGPDLLLQARQTYKREKSIESLTKYIDQSSKILKGHDFEDVQFSGKAVWEKLRKDKFFESSYSKEEKAEIKSLLNKLNKIPSLRPGAGINVGSYRRMGQLLSGSMAGGSTLALTHDPTISGIATVGGALLPPGKEYISVIAQILGLKAGRNMLKEMLKKGPLTQNELGALAAIISANNADLNNSQLLPELAIPGEPPPSLMGPLPEIWRTLNEPAPFMR